jgi:hypothetical protein
MTGAIEGLSQEFQFAGRTSEPMDQQDPNPSSIKQDMPTIALEFRLRTHAQLSHSVEARGATISATVLATEKARLPMLAINVLLPREMRKLAGRHRLALCLGGRNGKPWRHHCYGRPSGTETLARLDGHGRLLPLETKLSRSNDVLERGRLQIRRNPEGDATKPISCGLDAN